MSVNSQKRFSVPSFYYIKLHSASQWQLKLYFVLKHEEKKIYFNLSLTELGLAERIQPQARCTRLLCRLAPSAQLTQLPSRQGSTEASPIGCFCCSSVIFKKTPRLNLFACLLFTAYISFFHLPTPSETELRLKPFYSLQKRTSSVFYGYRAPAKSELT